MTDQNLTEIAIILDRSGSMETIREDMVGGYKTFMDAQAAVPGKCVVSLYQFDGTFDVVYEAQPIMDVPRLDLDPRGSTALHDACGKAVTRIGKRLRKLPDHARPSKVVVLVITDGHENASTEFTAYEVRAMFRHQTEKYGWQFVYLGANVDAFHEASQIGAATSMNYQANPRGVARGYGVMGQAVASYRSSRDAGAAISNSMVEQAAAAYDAANPDPGALGQSVPGAQAGKSSEVKP